jgi:hypothetical protein
MLIIKITVKKLCIDTYSVFDRAFSNINKQNSNEMHLDCLLLHLNPTYMFRQTPAILRVVL